MSNLSNLSNMSNTEMKTILEILQNTLSQTKDNRNSLESLISAAQTSDSRYGNTTKLGGKITEIYSEVLSLSGILDQQIAELSEMIKTVETMGPEQKPEDDVAHLE